MVVSQEDIAVNFDAVSIVFGTQPETALPLMDKGLERAEIQELTGQILGVHNCSLEVKRGEVLVLMGLSGSGKSTLLRAVNGLNSVTRGEVTVQLANARGSTHSGGKIMLSSAGHAELMDLRRNHIAMVFQQFGLLPWRSVAQNVGLGLELSGMSEEQKNARVTAQLELVGLSERADAQVSELSGGMQQRVGLARAYTTDASVLLMDEPFSALDPLIRTHLQDELLEHQKKLNCSIIFVSHDLDEAFKLGDRIAIMEGGRIIQVGTPREIFHNPSTEYVANFVKQINPLSVLVAEDILPFAKPWPKKKGQRLKTIALSTPAADLIAMLNSSDTPLIASKGDAVLRHIDKSALFDCFAHFTTKPRQQKTT